VVPGLAEKGRGVKAVPHFPLQRFEITLRVKIGDPEKMDIIVKGPDIFSGVPDAPFDVIPHKRRKGGGKDRNGSGLVPNKNLGGSIRHIGLLPGIVKDAFFQFRGNITGAVKGAAYRDKGDAEIFGDVLLGNTHY
jgi:hypothetical protein